MRRMALIAISISGMSALIYEVVSSKVLLFLFSESTYSIATVLVSFMLGLAVGSYTISKLIERIKNKRLVFALIQLTIALYGILVLSRYEFLFQLIPYMEGSFFMTTMLKFLIGIAVLSIPTYMLGASFPLVASMYIGRKHKESRIGIFYTSDLIGAMLGSFLAGFIFLPIFGLKTSVLIAGMLNIVNAFLFMKKRLILPVVCIVFIFLLTLLPSNPQVSESGTIFSKNSPFGEISVVKNNSKVLYIDNRVQCASNSVSERNIASIGLSFFDTPPSVLNIGLGCGMTLSSILKNDINEVDVVEINPVVVEAQRLFSEETNYPFLNNKTNLIIDDAWHFVHVSDKKYDAIIMDVEDPTILISSPLYTDEFFKEVKKDLNDNGVFAVYGYEYDYDYLNVLYHTFRSSFNYVYIKKDMGVALIFSSQMPLQIELTSEEINMINKLQDETEFEINTINKMVLQKYIE